MYALLAMTTVTMAQTMVKGKVTTTDGEELPGVSIIVKGSSKGAVTGIDGNFSLEVDSKSAILVFSYIGFLTQEIQVDGRTDFNISLVEDITQLTEVVVIGYGTQRREDVTTAVTTVKPKEFVQGAVRNAGELLRGKVAGLTISTSSGDPEAGIELLLRGVTSIYGSSAPLVLIDGYPGGLNSISPNDIESIDVLKDASASAIYGTRGKNGVILITTKKAKGDGSMTLEYSGYVSTDRFQKTADFMSADDVRGKISEGLIDPSYDLGGNTNWLDEISRSPLNHFHDLSLRGGNQRTTYSANVSFQDAEGIFLGSDNTEAKFRMELDHYLIEDKLKVNANVLKGIQKYGAFDGWTYRQALIRNPTDNVTDNEGNWVEHPDQFQYENPLGLINERKYDNNSQWTWLTGSASYFPLDGLELKVVGSRHEWSQDIGNYETKKHISNVRDGKNGVAYISNNKTVENFLDLTANYSKNINKHRVSALLGYSYIDWENYGNSITNFDFPTDNFTYNSIEQGRALREGLSGAGVDSWRSDWKLIGFFGRVGYGFDDKYNILASLRYEGSSRFGDDNKWGFFPAISAGWTISNEAFLSDASTIDNLKLRVGYGRTGSISSNPYESLTRYAYSSTQFYFNGQDWVSVLSPVANPNPNLGWETNVEYNIGLDFELLQNVISGSIDLYDRTLEDLVYDYPVPVPPNLVGTTKANAASMSNKGIEVAVNITPIKREKFEWVTSLNYSRNTNKLESLSNDEFQVENDFFYDGYTGDPIQLSTHKVEEGEAIGSFWGYKSVGLDDDGKWLIESGVDGEIKALADAVPDDMQILGNGLPQWYAAWNNYFRYGRFDLNITMRGAFDYQILNFQRMFYENPTVVYNKLASSYDEIDGKVLASPQSYVSHYIEDGDFWKIDNITLGYNFNTANIKGIKSARVYVSGSNLFTITNYKGLDPEVTRNTQVGDNSGLAPGNDSRDKYPTVRTFTLGANLRF
ncbi:SusC/RagA family TonB-linked outer membrane protein [Flammeovirgaceae bacterium SG7u.111]|nr:SusC/RagA family TonB-linked outer membrane protein [Flammeovirgaceae bacterium SG7u.132]WPO35149.1 SusC/RagA family TonB-linked outer membrane protein [Flammeovirgaceae bacterium SG7u.111]